MSRLPFLLLCFVLPTMGLADGSSDLVVADAYAFETPKTAMAGAGYLTIENVGERADRLLAVEADFPQVMVHTTEETDGVARMIHLDSVEIGAGETVTFAPGGFHVMFMGLGGDPFDVDEEVPATLVFENAGRMDVIFRVIARD